MLAVCSATELNPRYGRLYAYLQDDVTRKLPSPRLVGQLLEGEGLIAPADVMVAFDASGRLRSLGVLKLLGDARRRSRSARSRSPTGPRRCSSAGAWTSRRQPTRLRLLELPAHDPGAPTRSR